jgi:photosystem II stability/assembly factor-like uncharacterized protein
MTSFQWQQSTLGGGGFIAGLLQDPLQPHIFYARSDVAGMFKSTDGAHSWRSINYGITGVHAHDTRSFALSPHDPDILFRGAGSVRGGDFFGSIFRSRNGGECWELVTREVDFYGNGEGRQYGEVIQVDPFNPAVVVAGGYTKGLWISRDGGDRWTYAGLRGERITCVHFHPALDGVIYVGTWGSFDDDPVFVAQQYDTVRPNPARLYRSFDRGASWEVLHEGLDFAELAFDPTSPDTLHAACLSGGVRRSADGGRTWTEHAPGLSSYRIGTVAVDPQQPQIVYAAAETFPNHDPAVPPIGVFRSADSGLTWALVRRHTEADLRNYPSYMELPYAGWAVSKLRVDAAHSRTLFMSNWYGVAVSEDDGETWDAHHFAGMENICVEAVTAHPARPGTVYMVGADHAPKVSADGGRTFRAMDRPKIEHMQPDSTALVASRHRPDLILYGIKGSGGCSIVRATADGSAPEVVFERFGTPDTEESRLALQSRAAAISVQALAEDPFAPGTFYAYLDGLLECGAGVWRTVDWGTSWEQLANPFPERIGRVPFQRHWIENELLSVVIAQTKNVCGTNQLLCADPHRPDTLLVGEWTEGVWRSCDGGQTWQDISAGLPFQRDRASVLNVLRADDRRPGVWYAGFIREGVWRTEDDGATWHKLFPAGDEVFNATTLAVGGGWMAVACEPLYYAPAASAVWISGDGGRTWEDSTDPRLGSIRWKTVALDASSATLYAGSCGNSAFFLALGTSEAAGAS